VSPIPSQYLQTTPNAVKIFEYPAITLKKQNTIKSAKGPKIHFNIVQNIDFGSVWFG